MALVRVITVVCLIALGFPVASDAQETQACIEPPPSDEVLVRSAAKWMLPARTIEIPEFDIGRPDAAAETRARVRPARGTGVSLMPVSMSVSRPPARAFSLSAVMSLAATVRVDYRVAGNGGSCDLTIQGPLAARAEVMVDRSQPTEDRVQLLTVDQVNDSGLQLQGCSEVVAGIPGFASDVRDHVAGPAVSEIFMPACRPCESEAFRACTTP
jgi:hypothetical protein